MLNELVMVEPRGVEPLSCDVIMTISTCLFCLYCFSSSGFADRQAAFRLAHLKSRTQTDEWSLCARTLLSPSLLVSVRERTSPSSGECVLFVRSYFVWSVIYEANDHPRHAIGTLLAQSNPERPLARSPVIYHCANDLQVFLSDTGKISFVSSHAG